MTPFLLGAHLRFDERGVTKRGIAALRSPAPRTRWIADISG
jgi:hypothetical protein